MKDKFLNKIVKKNYNNKLEEVLVNKDFSEDVKNALLNMLYKIENGYDDYNKVKVDTFEKNEFLEKIIDIIDKDCEQIEFLDLKQKDLEIVDSKNKIIKCLPIDNKILYAIAKIQKRTVVVRYLDSLIEEAFSYLLNTGNNINIVEPLRDFNGFSWNVLTQDIEDLNCNLIYQNIIYLMGNSFVDKWVNNYEPLVDYFDLFQSKIETKYGKQVKDNITNDLIKLSVIIKENQDDNFKENIERKIKELTSEKEEYSSKKEYIIDISQNKKDTEKKIKKIDKMLIDKQALLEEYNSRNEKLPLEKKIFSIRVLKNILKEERNKLLEELDGYNNKMNPFYFINQKNNNEKKLEYMELGQKENNLINLQKQIIECMLIDVKNAEEKSELIDIIYKYRYYSLLPVNKTKCINNIKELKPELNKLCKCIINKAIEMKVIVPISNNNKINYFAIEKIFLTKIISLEDINIQLSKQGENFIITIFDEKIEDSKIVFKNVSKKDFDIKTNKKVKLFI